MASIDKREIGDRLRKEERQKAYGRMSRSYAKYFEGWTEYTVPVGNGNRTKICRVYTGDYYIPNDEHKKGYCRPQHLLIPLAAFMILLFCGIQNVPCNLNRICAGAQCACVFFSVWMSISGLRCLFSDKKLTIYEYRTLASQVKISGVGTAVSFGILTLVTIGTFFLRSVSVEPLEVFAAMLYLLCGGVCYADYRVSAGTVYKTIPSGNKVPAGGFTIGK